MSAPTVVVVPGLRGAAPAHWQELYAARTPGTVTVGFPPKDRWHDLHARTALIEDAVAAVDGSVILLAHSAGVLATVHWARTAGMSTDSVIGAVLATPPDFDVDWPEPHPRPTELAAEGWTPIPRARLPFPSILAASRNDPLARMRSSAGLAEVWGSRLVDLGDAGHLNPASGFGEWPLVDDLITEIALQRTS
ncbi:alpha/beta hydrolase [Gordonia sp. PDNC005]|uniref:RBBP9/YdeN family alpha/beta hydrolase n=1 Tax=unclassified Gordonia (in: high G+C Gram-positive bacteria) TaxID=2657482 RepID=UPI0019623FB9|nr:alpha/beta hydrolase [Gordonia sp. PDNC005]QRY64193.1 alpha/beta hydrolase [Gordonia sp. PDNC005]